MKRGDPERLQDDARPPLRQSRPARAGADACERGRRARGQERRTYQRLEFLGDRVLGLVVADMLDERFPQAPEGELSRRLARLVSGETCAEVAREMELAKFLRIGDGIAESRGAATPSVLADVCEAVLGAVYRDGGLAAARAGDRALLAAAARGDERAAPRRQDRAAGMGASARLRRAGLCRDAPLRPRPRAGIRDRGQRRRRRSRGAGAGAPSARPSTRRRPACSGAKACGAA